MLSEPDDTNPIWRVWLGLEQPVGAFKPHSRITVEPGWRLRTTDVAGSRPASKLPIRYFVRQANDQQEVEIPGIRKWTIVEDIDQDADTLVVELTNNHFDPDYSADEWRNSNGDFGAPGYLTPDRGVLSNRWGYVPNEWAGMLTKNALIRVYDGYGGAGKTLAQAVADGNLVMTGPFLVDDTPIQTGQGFQMQARNMGKLLVDQPTLPPLIPDGDYPMSRSRFHQPILSPPIVVYGHLAPNPHQRVLRMERPKTSDGYWLAGTDGGVFAYGLSQWHGSIDSLGLSIPAGAYPNIGITAIGGSAGGEGYRLVTNGGAVYCFGDAPFHGSQPSPSGVVIAIENAGSLDGYWLFTDNGSVYSFGPGAAYFGGGPPLVAGHKIADAASTPSGLGYWMVDDHGFVYSYGDAPYLGGLTSAAHPIVAIAPTPDGAGYYLLGSDGGVFCFGDAPFYGSAAALTLNDPMSDMVVSVDGTGYWLCAEDGGVFTYVANDSTVQFYGSMPGGEDTEGLDGDYLDLCVDEETEAFTQRGWLGWRDIRPGDRTLSLDPATGFSFWQPIENVNVSPPRSRRMWLMETSGHSSLTTMDHRWPVTTGDGRRRWTTSAKLNTSDRLVIGAERGDAPVSSPYKDEFVELVAWFYTEGSYSAISGPVRGERLLGGQISQSYDVNPAYEERIRACLSSLYGPPRPAKRGRTVTEEEVDRVLRLMASGLGVTEVERRTGIGHRAIRNWMRNRPFTGPSWNESRSRTRKMTFFNLAVPVVQELNEVCPEKVPSVEFLCSLTLAQLELFIGTSLDADNAGRHSLGEFSQSDIRRVEAFQIACVLTGSPAHVRKAQVRKPFTKWTTSRLIHRRIAPLLAAGSARRSSHPRRSPPSFVTVLEYAGRVWCPTVPSHNWLARRHGKVYFTGNSDVVRDLALYSGWNLYDGGASDNVYGVVEQTGVYSPDQAGGVLDAVFFDRQSVMDVLKKFRDAVGWLLTVDKWGGLVWREANVWESGNFLMDNSHTLTVPVLDERVNLKSYNVNTPDKPVVSSILISAALPEDGVVGIPTTTFVPANAGDLRGIVKPAEYINALFLDPTDELTMAELIALQLYFKSRLGTAVTIGCPMLSKDDQVQIIERETSETNTFYVRKHERSHDRKSGDYSSTFTVNVLSPPGVWAVVKPDGAPSGSIVTNRTV